MFSGSMVALITPFKNGRIDEAKLRELVEWHIEKKTSAIVPVGTTGESATLSHKEHMRVIEVVVKAVRKRVPVIAGAGSNSTDEAVDLTRGAKRVGADAVLSVNPYYNRPTQEGMIAHFAQVAKVGLPVLLYNIPSRTGVNLTGDTIVALAKAHSNIVGVKESTGNIDQSSEVIQRLGRRFVVVSGDDSLTLPIVAVGGTGVISVAANLVPDAIASLVNAALSHDLTRAQQLHAKLFPLIKSLFLESNPSPVKAAMAMAGLIKDESLRLPMVSVTKATRLKVKAAMKEFGGLL